MENHKSSEGSGGPWCVPYSSAFCADTRTGRTVNLLKNVRKPLRSPIQVLGNEQPTEFMQMALHVPACGEDSSAGPDRNFLSRTHTAFPGVTARPAELRDLDGNHSGAPRFLRQTLLSASSGSQPLELRSACLKEEQHYRWPRILLEMRSSTLWTSHRTTPRGISGPGGRPALATR